MSSSPLPVYAALLAVTAAALLLRRHLTPPSRTAAAPYIRLPALLSPAERSF